eukprot:4697669-Prymnesium_polylepis.1
MRPLPRQGEHRGSHQAEAPMQAHRVPPRLLARIDGKECDPSADHEPGARSDFEPPSCARAR